MRRHLFAASLAAALALSACSQPQPPAEPEPEFPVSGSVSNMADVPMPTFASFAALHPSIYGPAADSLVMLGKDYEGRIFAIDSVPLAADGSFEWDFGDGSDIPAGYLTFASQALYPLDTDTTCTMAASNSAQVLRVLVGTNVIAPAGILGPMSHTSSYVDGLLMYTDATDLLATPTEPFRLGSWTWASEAVTIEGTCVYDNGVDPQKDVIEVDLDLEAGWNPLVWTGDPVAGTATVVVGTFEGSWLAVVIPTM